MRSCISIRGCVRPSVHPSVGPSIRRSARPSVHHKRVETIQKYRFHPKLLSVRARTHLMPRIRLCLLRKEKETKTGRGKRGTTPLQPRARTFGSAGLNFLVRVRAAVATLNDNSSHRFPMALAHACPLTTAAHHCSEFSIFQT